MTPYPRNPVLKNEMLPVEVVFHPAWWHHSEGITFDEDFFYHPARRVEAERKMEQALYERFGRFGLGADRDKDLPVIGAVHNAAGFLVQEMLGCRVEYREDVNPQVIVTGQNHLSLDGEAAFQSPAYKRFERLLEALETQHGYLTGDVNWGGVLNVALDIRGADLFLDFFDRPKEVQEFFRVIAECIDRLTMLIEKKTGTTSHSVNRIVRHLSGAVFLHSECSHTMISNEHYERFLMRYDKAWSEERRPFGIHYCGEDPHRYNETVARLPHLDFLDVGWGGDVKKIRAALPETFLSIRLSPVEIIIWSEDQIRETIARLVQDSGNPYLTGVCCINMDESVTDEKVAAIFETVEALRVRYAEEGA